jgi:hypothetical protein
VLLPCAGIRPSSFLTKEKPLKIRILESLASSAHGSHGPGDVVDWKDSTEAKQLIASGAAEAVKSGGKKKTETASKAEEVETATAE